MSGQFRPSRRAMLRVGLAGAATIASPAILRLTAKAVKTDEMSSHGAHAVAGE